MRAALVGLLAAITIVSSGCSCAKQQEESPPEFPNDEHEWAIHVYAGTGDARKRVDFGPISRFVADPSKPADQSAGAKTKAFVYGPDGGTRFGEGATYNDGTSSAWGLLAGAAAQCAGDQVFVPPWQGSQWFVFPGWPTSCDELVRYEESLLCIADKLKEIADAVGPITWSAGATLPPPLPELPWTIPPQAAKDRFIARDLAMHTLAQIARLDRSIIENASPPGQRTCAKYWLEAYDAPSTAISDASVVFGATVTTPPSLPAYPISQRVVDTGELPNLALERLELQGHILRGAGRMMHDLLRDSVYADLAGVEQRRARAMDPYRGSLIAWGVQDGEAKEYNTLRHTIGVLTGRAELGAEVPHPSCGGTPDIMHYGGDVVARVLDLHPRSNNQALAATLLGATGLILNETDIRATSGTALRAMVKSQLVESIAFKNTGVATTPMGDVAEAADKILTGIPDEDFRFALKRNLYSYTLTTNAMPFGTLPSSHAALPNATFRGSAVPSAALVIKDGIDRSRAARDIFARFGGILANSQCDEVRGPDAALFIDHPRAGLPGDWPLSPPTNKARYDYIEMQDNFSVAQMFQRRLTALYQEAENRAMLHGTPTARLFGAGSGELRSWAGPGRVFLTSSDAPSTVTPTQLSLTLAGFDKSELGFDVSAGPSAALGSEFTANIGLVYGEPWVAECATGLRDDCPADFETHYVLHPSWVNQEYHSASVAADKGFLGTFTQLSFSVPTGTTEPVNFRPQFEGSGSTPSSHLYVLSRKDPHQPGKAGQIIASLAVRSGAGSTSAIVSSMQRELLRAAFGMHSSKDSEPSVGESSLATGPDYCIDGVPRDLFVPLENELTSDGDQYESSWRHYLTLAKQAAERTDTLGEKLVALGERTDLRREAAGEELAEMCGDVTALESVYVDGKGEVMTEGADSALAACLGEKKTDVVFLSKPPPTATTPAKAEAYARSVLCGSPSPNEICSKPTFTVGFLGLVEPPGKGPASPLCSDVIDARGSMATGFDPAPIKRALSESYGTPSQLAGVASGLRMTVDPDGEWTVVANNSQVLMKSNSTTEWPGCLRTDLGGTGCDWTKPEIVALNRIFRNCGFRDLWNPLFPVLLNPGYPPSGQGLGACSADGVSGDPLKELLLLRWRVEGALWLLGAASGQVPSGMFTMPVPVYASSSGSSYDLTRFNSSGVTTGTPPAKPVLNLGSELKSGDGHAIGTLETITPRFFAHPGVGPDTDFANVSELPSWFETVYPSSGSSPYVHAFARNGGMRTDFTWINMYMSDKKFGSGTFAAGDYLNAYATMTGGMRCNSLYGSPATPPAMPADEIVRSLGLLKMQVATNEIASAGLLPRHMYWWFRELKVMTVADKKGYPDTTAESWPVCRRHPFLGGGGLLTPTQFPAGDRIPNFVNSMPPCTPCGVAAHVVEATGLACVASRYTGGPVSLTIPPIDGPQDLGALAAWAKSQGDLVSERLSTVHLEKIPTRLVEDFLAGKVGVGKKGTHGNKLNEIANAIEGLHNAWSEGAQALKDTSAAIAACQIALQKINLEHEKEHRANTIAVVGSVAQTVGAAASALSASKFPGNGAAAVAAGAFALQTGLLYAQFSTINAIHDTEVKAALQDLSTSVDRQVKVLRDSISNGRTAINNIQMTTEGLSLLESKAKYKAAVASSADFYMVDGKPVKLPVNSVLRRQFDAMERRYKRSLNEAKYLAFLARRAIEQRLGVPLKDMTTPVGPLDAPSIWADDVCKMSGIDYSRLRTATGLPDAGPDAPTDKQLVDEFADAFIGDYVEKLGNLVDYYNVAYPSHEGDDTALLSLREDLLPGASSCLVDAPNLFYYSGRLDVKVDLAPIDPTTPEPRWQLHGCESATKCLRVVAGEALATPSSPPTDATRGHATWLHDIDPLAGVDASVDAEDGDTSVSDAADDTHPELVSAMKNAISQTVYLEAGNYVLSWWDQARTSEGNLASESDGGTIGDYRMEIVSSGWVRVESYTGKPHVATYTPPDSGVDAGPDGGPDDLWGMRREKPFTIKTNGFYRIAFSASLPGAPPGSVAIANVQLERAPPEGKATEYVATDSSRQIVTSSCKNRSSDELRSAFRRICLPDSRCYYELIPNIVINTYRLNENPGSPLAGKLARGNFNFRHITVGLNLVGTGVRTCAAGAPSSCYGSGFTEYTLRHDALRAGILDWDSTYRFFNFGVAPINHGKALAAERYITMPIGSADQSLLAQPGIEKSEFRGRPLDGIYSLRIWDDPALHWERLEDVQIVLKYRYWSRIDRNAKAD